MGIGIFWVGIDVGTSDIIVGVGVFGKDSDVEDVVGIGKVLNVITSVDTGSDHQFSFAGSLWNTAQYLFWPFVPNEWRVVWVEVYTGKG